MDQNVSKTNPGPGDGLHGGYYYLWHLTALGIIDADYGSPPGPVPDVGISAIRNMASPQIGSTVWDVIAAASEEATSSLVAVIDVGVSMSHPNLASRVDRDNSIDLATHRYGARALEPGPGDDGSAPEQKHGFFADLDIDALGNLGLGVVEKEMLDEIVAELVASQGVLRKLTDVNETFASHGTAIAGLIVGEPAAVEGGGTGSQQPPEDLFAGAGALPDINPNAVLVPYFGADPFSRLISVGTSFEDDPLQFIAAFLYAWKAGADVVVLPRGLPDPIRSRMKPKNELMAELEAWETRDRADLFARLATAEEPQLSDSKGVQRRAHDGSLWTILERLIVGISKHVPIICAAGNEGESQLIYPARLADRENGIVAVGAVTPQGFRSVYSNYGEGLTLVAPSDDAEVFNRHQLRIDRLSPFIDRHHYEASTGVEYAYSHFGLLTTDLPGVFGYDSGAEPLSSHLPFAAASGAGGGYYTSFGGTSGACALVGGISALVQRAHRARHGAATRLDGLAVKSLLTAASDPGAAVLPGYRPLTPDCMNLDGEDALAPVHFFGAGLVNARKAVEQVLTG
jgi:subtilisin family serine protease